MPVVTEALERTPSILNPLPLPTGSRTTTLLAITQASLPAMQMRLNLSTATRQT